MHNEMKPYDEYRNTGQEWLECIPNHWKQMKAKRMFIETSIKNHPDEELLSATQNQGVIPRSMLKTRVVMPTGNFDTFKLVKEGNFVISLRSFQGGLEYSKYRGLVSPAYTVLEEATDQNKVYYQYLLKSAKFIWALQRNVTGIREGKNIDVKDFKEIILPIPPKVEQNQIVRFLDSSLVKINMFIKTRKKLIKLLKEQKQAVINEAVTKGIDPNVRMKPSGVDWLGDIPEDWETRRIKRLFRSVSIKNHSGEPFLSVTQLNGVIPKELVKFRVVQAFTNFESFKLVQPGNFVISLRSFQGGIEYSEYRGIVSPAYTVLESTSLINDLFFKYLFKCFSFIQQIQIYTSGIRQGKSIDFADLREMEIAFPSDLHEQERIARYIIYKSNQINKYISAVEKEIFLINEYRTRLISDVVTGKVDVRGITINEVVKDLEEELDEETIEESLEEEMDCEDGEE